MVGDLFGFSLLTTGGGAWTILDVSATTPTVSAFASTGTSWTAYDLAYDPSSKKVYGMDGTTLFVGQINAAGTSVAVTTSAVTIPDPAIKSSDRWGAAYIDSAGDGYFFDNTTFDLVEISATDMASSTSSAVSITQANSLTAPNDGASCPTASSPLAPTVVTSPATSVTTTGSGVAIR